MNSIRGTIAATFFAIALAGIAVTAQQHTTPAPATSLSNKRHLYSNAIFNIERAVSAKADGRECA